MERVRTVLAILLGALISIPALGSESQTPLTEKLVMGWLESVFIEPWNLRVTAKLDTGAKTSSVNASEIERFAKNGKSWVRFVFTQGLEDEERKKVVIERPVVRLAVIKERSRKSTTREVVTLTICKNGRRYETEFTLNDRSNFNYSVLLGRSYLENVALVDASGTFLFKANQDPCRKGSSEKGLRALD